MSEKLPTQRISSPRTLAQDGFGKVHQRGGLNPPTSQVTTRPPAPAPTPRPTSAPVDKK